MYTFFPNHQLEQEIQKVHRAQEELVASCERRERLERVARSRLQSDCRRIQEMNRALREQLEMLTASRNMSGSGSSVQSDQAASVEALKRDVGKREVLIAQLITQSKISFRSLFFFMLYHLILHAMFLIY